MFLMLNQLVPQNVQVYSQHVTQTKVVIRFQLCVRACVSVHAHAPVCVLLVYKCSTIHFILRVSNDHFCSLITLCSSTVHL